MTQGVSICVALVLTTAVLAEPDTATQPSAPSGLAAAKSEYDAINATKAGRPAEKLPLPAMPPVDLKPDDYQITPSPVIRNGASTRNPTTGRRSANWLVDAMTQHPTTPALSGGQTGVENQSEEPAEVGPRDLLTNAKAQTLARTGRGRSDQADASDKVPKIEVVNPLNTYMDVWMTPRDFELLGPKPAEDLVHSAPVPAIASGRGVSSEPTSVSEFVLPRSGAGGGGGPIGETDVPAINPYLAAESSLGFVPPTASAPQREPASFTAAPPKPADEAKGRPRESLDDLKKARDDEKYFKQLKRF